MTSPDQPGHTPSDRPEATTGGATPDGVQADDVAVETWADEGFERRRDRVVAALDRLARGEFARCTICGTQVDDRRLKIAPEADRCQRHITHHGAGYSVDAQVTPG